MFSRLCVSFGGGSLSHPYGYWLPLDLSRHGWQIDRLINLLHVFMVLFFLGWAIYLGIVLYRFRERPGQNPSPPSRKFRLPFWIEVGVVVFELTLLVFLSSPLWYQWKNQMPVGKDVLHIRVIAQQYQWVFHYPGRDGRFGRSRIDLIDDANFIGLDRSDPDSKDDIVSISQLHIPINRPIVAFLSSKDVIHNFYLPVLRVKQDVIPGMTIPVWFEATQPGQEFEIACAQLCGIGHTNMRGSLHIDTADEYETWMKEQESELRAEGGAT